MPVSPPHHNPAAASSSPVAPPVAWSAEDLAGNPHEQADKAARVERMFAAIARSYDLNNRIHSFGRDQAWRRKAVEFARIAPADRVLDVACGTGDLTEALAVAGGGAEVIGLDFTRAMLDIAEHKTQRARRPAKNPPPTYIQGDATQLPFEDARFDVVTIAFGLRNVSDPARALSEFRRVLRNQSADPAAPPARLVILEFSEPRNPLLRWGNRLYCGRIMPWTATLIARDRSGAYRYLPRSVKSFMDRATLCKAIEHAGFTNVTLTPLTFGVAVVYTAEVR